MRALEQCPDVATRFITRDHYSGHAAAGSSDMTGLRREYLENLIGSDYVLCVRGWGNFSFRFYETMSVGRVPILIDTDCVLPYGFLHDYREHCVIVPESQLGRIGEYVMRFHNRYSNEEFRELQLRIRKFWSDWLSPEGYFKNIHHHWRDRQPVRVA